MNEHFLTVYHVLALAAVIFLTTIWEKGSWLDTLIKCGLVVLSLIGTVVVMKDFGWI